MNSILYHNILNLIFPMIFIFGGIYLIIIHRKNKISIIISFLLILVAGNNLKNTLYKFPSLTESKLYYTDFRELEQQKISELIIETELINRTTKKSSKRITDKKKIEQILISLNKNELVIFEFKDWSPKNFYSLEFITTEKNRFKIDICESNDKRSYIDLLYYKNEKFVIIGRFRNNLIKSLNVLELI